MREEQKPQKVASINLSYEEHKLLTEVAKREHRTNTNLVKHVLLIYLDAQKSPIDMEENRA